MPHAVIQGEVSAERVYRDLGEFRERVAGLVMHVGEAFLARSGHSALIEAVVVEGTTRRFLVEILSRDDGVTVRLYPQTDPEKTPGVRRLLAEVAARVRGLDPGARIVRSNLPDLAASEAE